MENRYNNNNEFERFIKQNADQYRMFPSEKVWKGIHNRLHTRRRWYGLGLAFLLLSTGVVTWVMLVNPGRKQPLIYSSTSNSNTIATPKETVADKNIQPTPLAVPPQRKALDGTVLFPSAVFTPAENSSVENPGTTNNLISAVSPVETNDAGNNSDQATPALVKTVKVADNSNKAALLKYDQELTTASPTIKNPASVTSINAVAKALPEADKKDKVAETPEKPADLYSLTIESVVNSYKKPLSRKKISWQAYITPTISYRALNENKTFINAARAITNSSTPAVTYLPSDLESVVNHRPDIGFQLGFSAGYPLSKRLKLISGLQFNMSKYDIQAYNYSNEVATVALSTAAGRTNTVSTVTNYRIEGGFNKAKWLRNFYFSAAVPVGLELKLIDKKRSYIGITATAQPTYLLDNRSYLVSTDYKNYVEIPSLTRKWNLNAGFEVFAGIKTGKTEWRVGPQVRYQTLSSYKNKYPIEERLFDFGLKLGVVLK